VSACEKAAEPSAASTSRLSPSPDRVVAGMPVPVRAHPDQLSLLANADPALAGNKRLVFDVGRQLVNAGREEVVDLYLAQDLRERIFPREPISRSRQRSATNSSRWSPIAERSGPR
jgi:hypothetical protein